MEMAQSHHKKKMIQIMEQCSKLLISRLTTFLFAITFSTSLSAQTINLFYSATCSHSVEARNFIHKDLKKDYPEIKVIEHNIFVPDEGKLMKKIGKDFAIRRLSVPLFVVEDIEYVSGYRCERTTGQAYRDALDNFIYFHNKK